MMPVVPLLLLFATLYDQSVVSILTREFPHAQFILVNADTGATIGRHWDSNDPVAFGSLMKPFTAVALKQNRGLARCNPKHCWLASGHGEIDLVRAIGESCNSYFLQKAASITAHDLQSVTTRFNLPAPQDTSPATLIGLGGTWRMQPEQIARAYAALSHDPDTTPILEGMRQGARSGTAKLLRGAALAKTGTAPCSHRQHSPGDGYVAMLYPRDHPRYVLLVQVHGVSGAEAARTGARMLGVLRDGK